MRALRVLLLALPMAFGLCVPAASQCLIPIDDIVSGGPGKDGIPALTQPHIVPAALADSFLPREALVLGVELGGEARAYPHNVLWWHEIVNDVLGGRAITVSYCPLTGSGMVYDAQIAERALSFGVSGLLFDNNLILYDRATDSLWSQMRVQAICGALSGSVPRLLPVVQSTWAAWSALHPETSVVSFETGFPRDYTRYPYGSYDQIENTQLLFPHSFVDPRRPSKGLVLGIVHGGLARAYPYTALGERAAINDDVAGLPLLVVFDRGAALALPFDRRVEGQLLRFEVAEADGFPFRLRDRETGSLWDLRGIAVAGPMAGARLAPVASYSAMWFAWASFQRGTEIHLP